jgi:hypothetical protein
MFLLTTIACHQRTLPAAPKELTESPSVTQSTPDTIPGRHTLIRYRNPYLGQYGVIYGKFYALEAGFELEGSTLNINGEPYDVYEHNHYTDPKNYKVRLKPGKYLIYGTALGYKHHPLELTLAAKDSVNLTFFMQEGDPLIHYDRPPGKIDKVTHPSLDKP